MASVYFTTTGSRLLELPRDHRRAGIDEMFRRLADSGLSYQMVVDAQIGEEYRSFIE
jgi:hypothetical protein